MKKLFILCLFLPLYIGLSTAGVTVSNTRLVYLSNAKQADLQLSNAALEQALVQAWVDDGDPASTPDKATAPFILTPPIAKIAPGKSQTLRLVYTGEPLPEDREWVYWLNVLDIPPKPNNSAEQSYLQFAVKSRIKIFYRPIKLTGNHATSAKNLIWDLRQNETAYTLQVNNPSPFYMSLADINIFKGETSLGGFEGSMAPPFSTIELNLDKPPSDIDQATTIKFKYVDDYGAYRDGESTILKITK